MPVRPVQLGHVVYRTRRFEAMLKWYITVFGGTVQYRNPALAFLAYDEDHHRLAFIDLDTIAHGTEDRDARGQMGVDHIAYDIASLADLLDNYAELKGAGIKPYWCVNHGISASLYYADPDGNQMEFSVDAFPSKAECSAYLKGPEMGANPVGVEFDPEDWLSKLRCGVRTEELLKIDSTAPVSPIRGAIDALGVARAGGGAV